MEEAREVEDVRPKEHAPRWASADGEAKEPLQCCGGFSAPPEPAGVAYFGGGGEEDADEDDGGE